MAPSWCPTQRRCERCARRTVRVLCASATCGSAWAAAAQPAGRQGGGLAAARLGPLPTHAQPCARTSADAAAPSRRASTATRMVDASARACQVVESVTSAVSRGCSPSGGGLQRTVAAALRRELAPRVQRPLRVPRALISDAQSLFLTTSLVVKAPPSPGSRPATASSRVRMVEPPACVVAPRCRWVSPSGLSPTPLFAE